MQVMALTKREKAFETLGRVITFEFKLYLIYSCYLTYSAIANASGTVPTHFTHVT